MGIVRKLRVAVLSLAFFAALGNLAYVSLTDDSPAEIGAAAPAPAPIPGPPPALLPTAASTEVTAPPLAPKEDGAPAVPLPIASDEQGTAPDTLLTTLFNRSADPSEGGTLPQAQSDADAAEREWRAWMAENGVGAGAMAIALPDGRVIGAEAGRTASTPAPVASLSKAITGLCLDGLLDERGLTWDTTLGNIAEEMSGAGVTPRPWNEHITLASLVTHTSGLSPDLTQGTMANRNHGALGLHRRIASAALAEGAINGTTGTYFYSNTNYAVLGVVIEALSGRPYAEVCMERVMTPAGVEGAIIQGRMGSMSSFAGWEVSAEDYARFAQHWFTTGQPYVDTPDSRPLAGNYALGYAITGRGPSASVTHDGVLCIDQFARTEHGATFMVLARGTVFAANWDGCLEPERYDDLRTRIAPHLR